MNYGADLCEIFRPVLYLAVGLYLYVFRLSWELYLFQDSLSLPDLSFIAVGMHPGLQKSLRRNRSK